MLSDHDVKPIILLSPDVRVQTESKRHKNAPLHSDSRKKSLIDSGIELLFKKHSKGAKDGAQTPSPSISHPLSSDYKYLTETTAVPVSYVDKDSSGYHTGIDEHHKWKLFDSIKIHTDKRRSIDPTSKYYLLNKLDLRSKYNFSF